MITTRYGTTINKDSYKRSIRNLCRSEGVPTIPPYELRHAAITHQVDTVASATRDVDWAGTGELMIWKHYRYKLRDVVKLPPPHNDTN